MVTGGRGTAAASCRWVLLEGCWVGRRSWRAGGRLSALPVQRLRSNTPALPCPPFPCLQALEGMLHGMGVKHIVVPAMKGVLPMWEPHFGYSQFT